MRTASQAGRVASRAAGLARPSACSACGCYARWCGNRYVCGFRGLDTARRMDALACAYNLTGPGHIPAAPSGSSGSTGISATTRLRIRRLLTRTPATPRPRSAPQGMRTAARTCAAPSPSRKRPSSAIHYKFKWEKQRPDLSFIRGQFIACLGRVRRRGGRRHRIRCAG